MNNNSKRAKDSRRKRVLDMLNSELSKGEKMFNPTIGNINRINKEIEILKRKLNI